VRVLPNGQWIEREHQLAGAAKEAGGIKLRKLDGVPLSDYLDSQVGSEAQAKKSAAILAATSALFAFHRQHNQSHGDASVTNVLISQQANGIALTWFDFDVAHTGSNWVLNRADDLRALLSTANASEYLDSKPLKAAYQDEEVWNAAEELLHNGALDIFHRAQQRRT